MPEPLTTGNDVSGSRHRRRSSIISSLSSLVSPQNPNSISNFATSYSRSANFLNADFDLNHRIPNEAVDAESLLSNDDSNLYGSTPVFNENTTQQLINSHVDASNNSVLDDDTNDDVRSIVFANSGNSTAPQTIFNGINTLIGIGILSLPLGLGYSGWVFGSIILFLCAVSSQLTAKLLAKCLLKNHNLKTYGDLALYSFGNVAHLIVVLTFTVDLLFAGISMIILFAESFSILTDIKPLYFKILISILFFISSFVKLSVLSHLSLIGIISTSSIVVIVLITGLVKTTTPGSLHTFAETSLWPMSFKHLLLSLGIFMSPFGGHAIFPELYKDMQHPHKYNKSCSIIFSFTWFVDFTMASIGYLMFGNKISDQITKSIMLTDGQPKWVYLAICTLMGLLPISKGPLILRPIITMTDQFTLKKFENNKIPIIKVFNRLFVTFVFFLTSLVFTNFGRIMSFLGSAICFGICIIYPLAFYLKLYYHELDNVIIYSIYFGIAVATVAAVLGTLAVIFV